MLLAAEFGTGQVLWSLLWFFLFFVWIMLIFTIFGDIIRSDDMGGGAKAIWSIFIIFLPFLGIFIYLISAVAAWASVRSLPPRSRTSRCRSTSAATTGSAGGSSDAEQLAKLADLHSSGKIDDAEYAAAKAKVIGS